jgi:hypothetical protein
MRLVHQAAFSGFDVKFEAETFANPGRNADRRYITHWTAHAHPHQDLTDLGLTPITRVGRFHGIGVPSRASVLGILLGEMENAITERVIYESNKRRANQGLTDVPSVPDRQLYPAEFFEPERPRRVSKQNREIYLIAFNRLPREAGAYVDGARAETNDARDQRIGNAIKITDELFVKMGVRK